MSVCAAGKKLWIGPRRGQKIDPIVVIKQYNY